MASDQSVEEVRRILDSLKTKVQTDQSLKKQLETNYTEALRSNGIDQKNAEQLDRERGGVEPADCILCSSCGSFSLSIV